MTRRASSLVHFPAKLLPFASAASPELPLAQLLRLSLFQVSTGMATVMLLGTLNRVMIVELKLAAAIVALMIALPVLIAPFRALLGHRSDTHRSAIGWRRIPYLWFGSIWQMGGLAVMPFALLVLGGKSTLHVPFAGEALAAVAFLMTGLGIHMTQTAGLALACDRAPEDARPRVVAMLYVMFLLGMGGTALIAGWLLEEFSELRLIRVVQGAAAAGMVLNLIALWRQERVRPMSPAERAAPRPRFRAAWQDLLRGGPAGRLLAAVFLGTMAFTMQDVLLEPYGGEILGLPVAATTRLTALWAAGALLGYGIAARQLARGAGAARLASGGLVLGLFAFCAVIFAAPMQSPALFYAGAALIGLGGGIFAVATLIFAMTLPAAGSAGRGLALGAWGAAQATAAGLSIALGGTLRDLVNLQALSGRLGEALASPATGYSFVYHLEIALIFATLIALGPLAAHRAAAPAPKGLPEFPG